MMNDAHELREMADRARDVQGDTADREADAYARGVEDVLRFLAGDAPQTPALAALLETISP
jgi:hypothetical protein